MTEIDNINGVSVSYIETLPVRAVILDDKVYSERYDETTGMAYSLDTNGQLTGEFEFGHPSASVQDDVSKAQARATVKMNKKELKKKIAAEKAEKAKNAEKAKKSEKSEKSEKTKTTKNKRIAKELPVKSKMPEAPDALQQEHTAESGIEEGIGRESSPGLFRPKAFILGMALVLVPAIGLFLYMTGGIL